MEPVTVRRGPAYQRVFSPLRIGPAVIANRVGISAHFAGWWATEGLPNDAFRAVLDAAYWRDGALVARDAFNAAEERVEGIEGVVIVGPSLPRNELAGALAGRTPEIHVIGDANQSRTIEEAVFQGGRVGRLL